MRNDNQSEHAARWSGAAPESRGGASSWAAGGRYQRLPGLVSIGPAMVDLPLKPATVPDLVSTAAGDLFPVGLPLQAVKLSSYDLRQKRGLPRRTSARKLGQRVVEQPARPAASAWEADVNEPRASSSALRYAAEARARAAARQRPRAAGRRTSLAEMWLSLQHVLAGHRLAQLTAILILVILAGSFEYSSSGWPKLAAPGLDRPFHAAMAALQQPIKSRAAFFILEEFDGNGDHWLSTGSLRREADGFTNSGGLALRLDTMELSDYRLDFEARIRSRAVGWVVRAADTRNYYAFKLVENGDRGPYLVRYPVIGGSRQGGGPVRVDLPAKLATADFNRVTVRVRGQQITTLVNGWGVDFWKDGSIPAGGVGLLSGNGETALVRKLTVTGNDDTWGLILYGTLETLRTLEEHFGSGPLAFQLQPFPAGRLSANHR